MNKSISHQDSIRLLNHCDYDKLGCGGIAADKTCESVFPIGEIAGSVVADSIKGDNVLKTPILFLNHCDYAKLGCGGAVAGKSCASILLIREVTTEYRSRWFEGEETET